jgi:hypothetical protein
MDQQVHRLHLTNISFRLLLCHGAAFMVSAGGSQGLAGYEGAPGSAGRLQPCIQSKSHTFVFQVAIALQKDGRGGGLAFCARSSWL